jgi:hypothetical protein
MKPAPRMPTSPKTTNRITESTNHLQEKIRCSAHELYEQRGKVDDLASNEWFREEAEMLGAQKLATPKAALSSRLAVRGSSCAALWSGGLCSRPVDECKGASSHPSTGQHPNRS